MPDKQLTTDCSPLTHLIIEEYAGITRINEPVTVGIPIPRGVLYNAQQLYLNDPEKGLAPLQTQALAVWPDKSIKWILLDFQVPVEACTKKELGLFFGKDSSLVTLGKGIRITKTEKTVEVDTNAAKFVLNSKIFRPFESVLIGDQVIIDNKNSNVILKDENGKCHTPFINNIDMETEGPVRSTLKIDGVFKTGQRAHIANFIARIHFFLNSSLIKIEFTIHNPKAAKHPGGLWDLGDPGSIYFKDISVNIAIADDKKGIESDLALYEDPVPMDYQNFPKTTKQKYEAFQFKSHSSNISDSMPDVLIYQDSSGGENWQSLNHVNRDNEVKTTFRGYKLLEGGMVGRSDTGESNNLELSAKSIADGCSGMKIIKEGFRANPILTLHSSRFTIGASIQYFWQNFPKALSIKENILQIKLFPEEFNDVFELQGGEQKTHAFFINFIRSEDKHDMGLGWVQNPLVPGFSPEYCARTKAIPFLISKDNNPDKDLISLVDGAIRGDNTFFKRREIIDEYGWRNFGELYADHEAVNQKGENPLVSHYNNQYDCLNGFLFQLLQTGELKWFLIADQLCSHIKDIDIYHTKNDRLEFNDGMFWHTEHYIDARTATHRCYSRHHAEQRNMAYYGGGPALSHNYATGLLLHYFLTGSPISSYTVQGLAGFVESNIGIDDTFSNKIIKGAKRIKARLSRSRLSGMVEIEKVYNLNGPSRASGNALVALLDAWALTDDHIYLKTAHSLILRCISPEDDIPSMELLDRENRWMYTVFMQALGKFLDLKTDHEQFDTYWHYAKKSLLHYAEWIAVNEYPYLDKPEQLEFPNETWAAQEIRKCNVLLYAAKYANQDKKDLYSEKADFFFKKAIEQFNTFDTRTLTRPLVLIMQNAGMHAYAASSKTETDNAVSDKNTHLIKVKKRLSKIFDIETYRFEYEFVKWKLKSILR